MKIRISVLEEKRGLVERYLTEHGIELGEEAEYMITETSRYPAFLSVRSGDREPVRLSADADLRRWVKCPPCPAWCTAPTAAGNCIRSGAVP